jgi:hypothetical protein
MVDKPVADPFGPDLGVRQPRDKACRGIERIICHLKSAGVDIDRNNSTAIAGFYLGPNLSLIQLGPAPLEFLYRVPTFPFGHGFAPLTFDLPRLYLPLFQIAEPTNMVMADTDAPDFSLRVTSD